MLRSLERRSTMLSGSTGSPQEVLVEVLALTKISNILVVLVQHPPRPQSLLHSLYFRQTMRSALHKLRVLTWQHTVVCVKSCATKLEKLTRFNWEHGTRTFACQLARNNTHKHKQKQTHGGIRVTYGQTFSFFFLSVCLLQTHMKQRCTAQGTLGEPCQTSSDRNSLWKQKVSAPAISVR